MAQVQALGVHNFNILKGDTVRKPFGFGGDGFEPTDITGWDAEFRIVDPNDKSLLLDANTGNGKVLIDGPNLTVTLYLTDTETSSLEWAKGCYTLKLIDTPGSGDAVSYMTGTICVKEGC